MADTQQAQTVELWQNAISDPHGLLQQACSLLTANEIPFCVIGGQAVSSYVEPVISLDFDLVVPPEREPDVERLFQQHYQVRRFKPFFSISMGNSDFRVQVQNDTRYEGFIERAKPRQVLGLELPVASLRDVFMSKIWAAQDSARRASKRQKDLADLARILEVYPHLRELLPEDIVARMY
jgi:hypothetical protein